MERHFRAAYKLVAACLVGAFLTVLAVTRRANDETDATRFVAANHDYVILRNLKWETDVDISVNTSSRLNSFSSRSNNKHPLKDDDNSGPECRAFHTMPNVSDICNFVKKTNDCAIDEGFIDYTEFIYCSFGLNLVALGMVIVFIWWLFLFIGLAVTADDFFCPSLTVISKTLRLSHNIAGVTFLAFGNGAPDIFSAIAAIGNAKNGQAGLAFGALFGAGVFVTTVVAGVIAIVCPFDTMQRPFLRDVIFYIAAVFWAFYIMWKKEITKWESIGFILLYVFYVIVVVVGRYIFQKFRTKPPTEVRALDVPDSEEDENDSLWNQLYAPHDGKFKRRIHKLAARRSSSEKLKYPGEPINEQVKIKSDFAIQNKPAQKPDDCDHGTERSYLLENAPIENYTFPPHHSSGDESDTHEPEMRTFGFKQFLAAVNPIDTESWEEMKIYRKIFEIFKSPVLLLLKLTIPVVDEQNKDMKNWNRYLNSLHCFTGLTFAAFATKVGFSEIGGVFPVYGLIMIVGLLLSITVFCVTKDNRRPRFHSGFAYLGFLVAVVWIYSIANEIVNILQTFGIVLNITNAILGLTLLAWGNSIGDFVADFAMARQGYPRMGISACFGGPLFNLLLGIGIPFTIATIKQGGTYKLQISLEEIILAGFLALSLVSSLIIVLLSKFHMSRGYGIYLWCLYIIFLVVAILAETNVIKGTVQ